MKRFRCPKCKEVQTYEIDMAGQIVACTNCGTKVRLPANPAPAKSTGSQSDEAADEEEERISTRPAAKRKAVEEDYDAYPDDEDELEEVPRRKRRKKLRRGPSKGRRVINLPGGFKVTPYALTLTVVAAIGLVFMTISFVWLPAAALLSILLVAAGALLALVGAIWVWVIAFQDDSLQGLLCVFVPFYRYFYAITHFDDCQQPLIAEAVGLALMFFAFCPMMCAGTLNAPLIAPQHRMPPPNFPMPPPPRR